MSDLTGAWQAALAAEHQAVFGYGILGPHLAAADRQLAYDCVAEHEALRDGTSTALAAAGHTPVPPEADYPALYPVPDAAAARRLALRLEEAAAGAWRYLYLRAATTGSAAGQSLRGPAQRGLTASAVRAANWRRRIDPQHPTTAFPGL